MKIGVIGTGNIGGTLGKLWAEHGHEVVFGAREPKASAAKLGPSKARVATIPEAAKHGDVVVLATPWLAAEASVRAAGDLSGKVLVDCTNPLMPDLSGLSIGHTSSAGELVARWARTARVVKCFNTLGAQHLSEPEFAGERASMFFCGDDEEAKHDVARLGEDLGFDMVDAGPLTQARLLEPLAMLWISLAYRYGAGTDIAFRLLRR